MSRGGLRDFISLQSAVEVVNCADKEDVSDSNRSTTNAFTRMWAF